jgi:hypothetical protein
MKTVVTDVSSLALPQEYMTKVALGGMLSELPDAAKVDGLGTDPNTGWLWPFLEKTSYVRTWEPGKMYLAFNLTERESSPDQLVALENSSITVNPHTRKLVVHGVIEENMR